MKTEYRYFKVVGGAVKSAYDRWLSARLKQSQQRDALLKEFGADACYANTRRVEGLVFKNPGMVPDGWKPCPKERTAWRPSGSSKEMRAVRDRLKSNYPLNDAQAFQAEVIGNDNPFFFMDGMSMSWMVFEKIGDVFILLVPKMKDGDSKGKWNPPDAECVELKTSEYWALKETAETNQPKP